MSQQQRVISQPGPLPGRPAAQSQARKGPAWKTLAPLSDELNSAVFACEEHFGRPAAAAAAPEAAGSQGRPIETLEEFYQWYAGLEAREREGAGSEGGATERLQAARKQCAALQHELGEAARCLDVLEQLHGQVEAKTSALHNETEALLQEKKQLGALAAALHENLAHFKTLDIAAATLNHSQVNVADASFSACLARLDEALKFVRAHPQYLGADKHVLRFSQLQQRGLTLITDHVVAKLQITAAGILRKYGQSGALQQADSFAYIDFRAIAPSLKPFCAELERRATDQRATTMLAECQHAYLSLRRQLCVPVVRDNLVTLANIPDIARGAQEGASYLSSLAHLELQLYHCFFDRETAALQQLLSDLAELWADELRPHVLQCRSAAALCGLLQALRSKNNAANAQWLSRMVGTAQERLVFVVQLMLRGDLHDDGEQAAAGGSDALDYPARLTSEHSQSDRWGRVQRAVALLRRLRAALDEGVFDGLAQECLLGSIVALVAAAEQLQRLPTSSVADSHLFLLKHVCLLRDETRELRVGRPLSERSIDFGRARQSLGALLKLDASALGGLLPELHTQSFDARKDLELLMLRTQEAYISAALGPPLQPLQGLLGRCVAVAQAGGSPATEPWFGAERVAALLAETQQALQLRLPEALAAARLYLPLSAHRAPLFQALQTACLEPLGRLLRVTGAAPDSKLAEAAALLRGFVERTTAEML